MKVPWWARLEANRRTAPLGFPSRVQLHGVCAAGARRNLSIHSSLGVWTVGPNHVVKLPRSPRKSFVRVPEASGGAMVFLPASKGRGTCGNYPRRANFSLHDTRVSVALCTYNGEEFLGAQLNSIAAQTRLPDELIICDDMSRDGTLGIVEQFARQANFSVRLERGSSRMGSQRNFEKATRLCTGELIFYCDQDDVWHPDKLLKLEQKMNESGSKGMVFSNINVVNERLEPAGYSLWQFRRFTPRRQKMVLSGKVPAWDYVLGQGIASGMGMGFHARFKDLILPFEGLGHDLWVTTLIAAVQDPVFVPEILGSWRQHGTQQTGAVTRSTFSQRLADTRNHGASYYAPIVEGYSALLLRLKANANTFPCSPHVLNSLEEKIDHLQARLLMRSGVQKGSLIAHEVLGRNYWKYGHGLRTLANDLFLSRSDSRDAS